jgi:hypothetical protein
VLPLRDLAKRKPTMANRGEKAEGTGLEPATPYGAPHLQDDAYPRKTRGKLGIRESAGADAGAIETKTEHFAPDLQAVIDAWPALPEPIKAGILAMVRTAAGKAD